MNLKGKKTYITAVVLGLASFALAMGWLDKVQYQVLLGLLGSLGLAALRSGVENSPDKAQEAWSAKDAAGGTPAAEGLVGGND